MGQTILFLEVSFNKDQMATPSLPVSTIKCPWAYLGLKKTLTEKKL